MLFGAPWILSLHRLAVPIALPAAITAGVCLGGNLFILASQTRNEQSRYWLRAEVIIGCIAAAPLIVGLLLIILSFVVAVALAALIIALLIGFIASVNS